MRRRSVTCAACLLAVGILLVACAQPPPLVTTSDNGSTNLAKFLPDGSLRVWITLTDPAFDGPDGYNETVESLSEWGTASFGSRAWVQRIDATAAFRSAEVTTMGAIDVDSPNAAEVARASTENGKVALLRAVCGGLFSQLSGRDTGSADNAPSNVLVYVLATGRAAVAFVRLGRVSDLGDHCRALPEYREYDEARKDDKLSGTLFGAKVSVRAGVWFAPYVLHAADRRGRSKIAGNKLVDPWLWSFQDNVVWRPFVSEAWTSPLKTGEVTYKNTLFLPFWEKLPSPAPGAPASLAVDGETAARRTPVVVANRAPSAPTGGPAARFDEAKRYLEQQAAIPMPDAYADEPADYMSLEDFEARVPVAELLRRQLSVGRSLSDLSKEANGTKDALIHKIYNSRSMSEPAFKKSANGQVPGFDARVVAQTLCPECTQPSASLDILPVPFGLREYNVTNDENQTEATPNALNRRGTFRRLDYECLRDYLSSRPGSVCPPGTENQTGLLSAIRFTASFYSTFKSTAYADTINHLLVRGARALNDETGADAVSRYARRTFRWPSNTRRAARLWRAFAYSMLVRANDVAPANPTTSAWRTLRELESGLSGAMSRQTFFPDPGSMSNQENKVPSFVDAALDDFEARFPFRDEVSRWLQVQSQLEYVGTLRPVRGYMKLHPDNLFRILREHLDVNRVRDEFPFVIDHCLPMRDQVDGNLDAMFE